MAKTEDGEFELILGNKQLLSVFFIVVVLLGVFFTMGYIVGKNTSAGIKEVAAAKPIIVEGAPPGATPAAPVPRATVEFEELPGSSTPVGTSPVPAPPPTSSKPVETAPATPLPKPTAAAKPAETKAPPPPLAKPQPPATVPQPGKNYLQVAATSKVEADAVVNLLAKKNFRAVLGPVPGQDLYRVLVGPVEEAALAATRTALQEAGFKPFTRRY